MPTAWVSHIAATFIISVIPPTLGSVERMKSTSWFSTSRLKSQRKPHSSPCVSGTVVICRSFGMSCRACSSRTGSSTKNGSYSSMAWQSRSASFELEALMEVDAPVPVGADSLAHLSAVLRDLPDDRARVVDAADGGLAGAHPERPVARLDRRVRAFLQAQRYAGGRG